MNRTSRASAYVAVYTFAVGIALLFLPDQIPWISYTAPDAVWVRILGMLLLVFSYFHFEMFRHPSLSIFRISILSQVIFLLFLLYGAISQQSKISIMLCAVVAIGLGLSVMWYVSDCRARLPVKVSTMPKTAIWNLYVSGYTCLFGILLAILPDTPILEWMGFQPPDGAWVRAAGLCFFSLCFYNLLVYFEKGPAEMIRAILNFRIGIVLTLIALTVKGYPLFLLVVAAIVTVGIIGTLLSLRKETIHESVTRTATNTIRGNHA